MRMPPAAPCRVLGRKLVAGWAWAAAALHLCHEVGHFTHFGSRYKVARSNTCNWIRHALRLIRPADIRALRGCVSFGEAARASTLRTAHARQRGRRANALAPATGGQNALAPANARRMRIAQRLLHNALALQAARVMPRHDLKGALVRSCDNFTVPN